MNKYLSLSLMFTASSLVAAPHYFYHAASAQETGPLIIALHGIVDNHTQAYQYFDEVIEGNSKRNPQSTRYLYQTAKNSLMTVRFDDAGSGIKKYYRASYSTLGQSTEIERVHEAYSASIEHHDSSVIHGVSRGASVAINFIAKHNPDTVKALVLESPFDSLSGIIQEHTSSPFLQKYSLSLASVLFPYFRVDGEHPINQIAHIHNKALPILIICSKQDLIVPWKCSVRIYKEFKERSFSNVHLIIADRGKHAKVLWGDQGDCYQQTTHAFLSAYGLGDRDVAYESQHASLLHATQPSLTEVDRLLQRS